MKAPLKEKKIQNKRIKLQNIETPLRHFLYKVNFIKELHARQAGPDSVEISWHNAITLHAGYLFSDALNWRRVIVNRVGCLTTYSTFLFSSSTFNCNNETFSVVAAGNMFQAYYCLQLLCVISRTNCPPILLCDFVK